VRSKYDGKEITVRGYTVVGTTMPVLATVPNAVSPVTLTAPTLNGTTYSGTFSGGSTTGSYSFSQTTGRGTALASSGNLFLNSNAVFYIITPRLMLIMGADQGVTNDAIGLLQF